MSAGNEAWIVGDFALVPFLDVDCWVAYKRNMTSVVVEHLRSDAERVFLADVRGGPACPAAWAPDGRTLYATRGSEIVCIDVEGGDVRVVAAINAVWTLVASPSGARLYFLSGRGPSLLTVEIATGAIETLMASVWSAVFDWTSGVAYTLRQVPRSHAEVWRLPLDGALPSKVAEVDSGNTLSLSHDGALLAFGDSRLHSGVRTIDVKSGLVRRVANGNEPSWSPKKRTLALMQGPENEELVVLLDENDVETPIFAAPGEQDAEARDGGWGGRSTWSPDGRLLAVTACRARFDHEAFANAKRGDEASRRRWSWRYEMKRAVFDFERREVVVRDGHWGDVAWRPSDFV